MVWFLFMQGKLQANRNVLLQFTYGLFLASSVCGDSNKNKHRNMAQCSQLVYNMENLLLTFIFSLLHLYGNLLHSRMQSICGYQKAFTSKLQSTQGSWVRLRLDHVVLKNE